MTQRRSPPFTALEEKLASGDWSVAFPLRPSRLRPRTTMSDFDARAEEAPAMARHLHPGAEDRRRSVRRVTNGTTT